jgi:hypothetical protein
MNIGAQRLDWGRCHWCAHEGEITVRVVIDQKGCDTERYKFCSTVCYLAWHDAVS